MTELLEDVFGADRHLARVCSFASGVAGVLNASQGSIAAVGRSMAALRRMSAVAVAVDQGTSGAGWPQEAQEWLASAADGVLVRAWSRLIGPQREQAQALAGVQATLDVFDRMPLLPPPDAMGPQ